MPFEQKYTPETRDASLARVLERRAAEPGNRSIIRETAEQFEVGEQSLRGWIRAYEKASAPEVAEAPAETPAPAPAAAESREPAAEAPAPVRRGPGRPSNAAISDGRIAELEAEVVALRRDREALKSALAVFVRD